MQSDPLNDILVVDDMPAIAAGLKEIFRSPDHPIRLEYTDNIFTALSSSSYEGKKFDLIVIGEQKDAPLENLPQFIAECKLRFRNSRIMLFTPNYDHALLEKMEEAGIDAYLHKYEPVDEIRRAFARLSAGEGYISDIFHTLYYEYNLRPDPIPPPKDQADK
jgi:DNA-binding NarL/FixJ family response regulator